MKLKLILSLVLISVGSPLDAAELLTYSGQMVGEKGDPAATTKRLSLIHI